MSTYYSSENRRRRPNCIVQPQSTADVSSAVKALAGVPGAGNWDIAVRSGGHSDWENNAVHRGVTIDLGLLNSIDLDGELPGNGTAEWTGKSTLTKAVARIGTGARWGDVMTALEPANLSATGGRSGHVGVGGLLVSGGASYHAQQWGLSCDNVVGVEVVLADGSVVEANPRENTDLFRALRGGGSNLGIVTRFDLRTFTVPPAGAYGGLVFTAWDSLDAVISQFVAYAGTSSRSPDHEFVVYRNDAGSLAIMAMVVSTDGNESSPAMAPWGSDDIPLTRDSRATQPLSAIAASIADTGGSHYVSFTLTLQVTHDIMTKAADVFLSTSQGLLDDGVPVSVNFVFQPMPKTPEPAAPGGNMLGHAHNLPADSILFEARATLLAEDAGYEGVVQTKLGAAIEQLREYSAAQEGHSPYVYMNYAHPEQDVLASYGKDNVEFLRDTAAKYDPEGFFQHRVPGGWKVSRVE